MNLTASPELAAQSLAGIIDPNKPQQIAFSKLGFANHEIAMNRYQTNVAHNAERRFAHEHVIFYGEIYIPLSSQHKGRGL